MKIYEDRAYGPAPIADSYWHTTAKAPARPKLEGAATADVAIVGAGFTGLNAALRLAEAGVDVIVLDAEAPGWGASGRNGGFCCMGGAKADAALLTKRHGAAAAREYFETERRAIAHVETLLERRGIDADRHSDGETWLAHRDRDVADLKALAAFRKDVLGVDCVFLPRAELAENGFASGEFHGALTTPVGFALNPVKYVLGLADAAEAAGARIHGDSRVTGLEPGDRWRLTTPHGEVRARTVLIATNGYSDERLPPWMRGRYLPVQSNILMTREMSDEEIRKQGWTSRQMCYDSRRLLHYFRLTPDNRMLFGLRGGARATPEADAATRRRARTDFERIFPAWAHVDTPHFWSGLVCVSRSRTPYVGSVPGAERLWTSFAYHGNGVAMGSWCGALAADMILGRETAPAALTTPPPRFELGRWRRAMLPLLFGWYQWRDR